MPPKKGQRKSMPARINKAPTLTPSRRSPRVPLPSKSTNENVQPAKTLDLTSTSPQDTSINLRFYTPNTPVPSNPSVPSPSPRGKSPETPSSRRRTFQSRPSRLSNVYTPTLEPPPTNPGSRRTRRTAALETPKKEASDIDFPESTGSASWTVDHYMGSVESEGTADGPSSPNSASDMRNSSRVRKPTMRALESFESTKRKPRRKNTTVSTTPTVETSASAPSAVSVPTKVVKNNVSKQPMRKTRKSKRMSNLNMRKNAVLIGCDIDVKVAGKILYDLTIQSLSPDFTLPYNFPAFLEQQRSEYFRRQEEEKYGVDVPTIKATSPSDVDLDVEMIGQEIPPRAIAPSTTPPTPPAGVTNGEVSHDAVSHDAVSHDAVTSGSSILGYKKRSDSKVDSDGWVQTGYVNSSGEEVALIPEKSHPYYPPHTYGYEGLPFPPVRARTSQQAEADAAHSFAPLMGDRNLPFDATAPFVTENVEEEKARALARTPVAAPATKKPRARKRRQTAAADATDKPASPVPTATSETGGRKSQRRRRQTAPAPIVPSSTSPTSPTSPPTTATKVQSSGPAAAVAPAATERDKPKVQRLRLTLKPAPKTEASGVKASGSNPAVQSPSSPALSRAPSSAQTSKRRRRRAM
ncbi:hypothetical protein N7537_001087 [Penicillium hordei]|uniref:Uncharacterized protein n=1 Tax=Penicillium hordei TaxID=40994 RepID=A0AAD6H6M4_9EURO|nr:uncharacterized protein N7537_001087 [Penicillium hordei]KAJ5615973.1 hypothetical protein N7537_001087 [Penicillium hordei]